MSLAGRIAILLVLCSYGLSAQKLLVYNAKDKPIHRYKPGKSIDFRVDYDKLYEVESDSVLEVRMYSTIDSIAKDVLILSENQVILHYGKDRTSLIEKDYDFNQLMLNIRDVKAVSFSSTMESVGTAFFVVGLAAAVVSPLFGLSSGGYATQRVILLAGIGLGTMAVGGTLSLAFKQKPVKIQEFNGPPYFNKYQDGRLALE